MDLDVRKISTSMVMKGKCQEIALKALEPKVVSPVMVILIQNSNVLEEPQIVLTKDLEEEGATPQDISSIQQL